MVALKLLDLMFVGDAPPPANASRLQREDNIRRRVDEIVDQRQRAADRAVANAAERVGLDEEWCCASCAQTPCWRCATATAPRPTGRSS
jgi:hypothetical protein